MRQQNDTVRASNTVAALQLRQLGHLDGDAPHLIARKQSRSSASAGRNSENSSTQLSGGSCSNSITDESLPKLPYGTCRPMRIGDYVSNDRSIKWQSSSEMVSAGNSLIVWLPWPATCVSSL
jgi:hypothetical protein